MRRLVTLAFLLLFTVPFGISISGCGKKTAVVFCNGSDAGPIVGQLTNITLQPKIFGISLNVGQFGQVQAPTGTDCKGSSVTPTGGYLYGTTDMNLVDIVPTSGRLCAGSWNRNTGGGIPDYTVCNVTNRTGTAFVTASGNGATSNPIPVFVHPVVTSVVLGSPSTDCAADPASNCSPAATTTTANSVSCTVNPATGCCTAPPVSAAGSFNPNSCLSQSTSGQLAARVYQGSGLTLANNISCQVGHLTYQSQTPGIVTVDENGIATAQQPGSTVITSSLSQAGSTAGFFSTCPPQSILLTAPGSTTGPNGVPTVTVNQNNTLPLTAVVTDTNNHQITGLALTYVSTTPTTLPSGGAGTVNPIFPGSGSITAVCQPPACNPSPLNQIGLFGNGKPITSNNVIINTPGNNSSILYTASTKSLYLVSVDFTTGTIGAPIRLPYMPNSMVISNDGSTIYMGSATELMVLSAGTNALSREDLTLPGPVLAVSPDNTTLVVTDPVRQTVSLATAGGGIQTTYGGVGTHAQFSPDSSTVYISAGNQLLVHSTFTGWSSINVSPAVTDVTVTVPSEGAFFAGSTTTARSYCPTVNASSASGTIYYPDAGVAGPATDRVAATNDGLHILGATANGPTLDDLRLSHGNPPAGGLPVGQCPPDGSALQFTATPVLTTAIPGITANTITGIDPTSDSTFSFITYTGTGGILPLYQPAATGAGALTSVKLSGTAVAPVAGVFSSDNATFFVGTSGDNLVHLINRSGAGYTDSSTIAPKLPDASGNIVTPDLIVQRPRKTA